MVRALVVYESVFGDAQAIAQAIGAGIATYFPVDVVAARDAPAEVGTDVGLLVVGGPHPRVRDAEARDPGGRRHAVRRPPR